MYCFVLLRRLSYLSLLFFGTLHSDRCIFPFSCALCLLFMGFSKQEYWLAIPFSNGPYFVRTVHHASSILGGSQALNGMAHSFSELQKTVIHVIILVSFLWLQSFPMLASSCSKSFKPLQYCKVISLQLIKINEEKKSFKLGFTITWTSTSRCKSWI